MSKFTITFQDNAMGLKCDQCKANTFHLSSANQFGCIRCFCMGITSRCSSSHWYRSEVTSMTRFLMNMHQEDVTFLQIRVSFTNSIRDFTLIEAEDQEALPIIKDIRLDSVSREIIFSDFPNRAYNHVYYWQLPSIFLGDQITSYGGYLRYTVRYVPSPGGLSSRNNAADVEIISVSTIH